MISLLLTLNMQVLHLQELVSKAAAILTSKREAARGSTVLHISAHASAGGGSIGHPRSGAMQVNLTVLTNAIEKHTIFEAVAFYCCGGDQVLEKFMTSTKGLVGACLGNGQVRTYM